MGIDGTIQCLKCGWSRTAPSLGEANMLLAGHQADAHGTPVEPTPREDLLTEAAELVHGDRDATYGPPSVNFGRIADALNAVYGPRLNEPFTASDVAVIQIIVKLSRQAHSHKRDNWLDIAGYAACGAEVDE